MEIGQTGVANAQTTFDDINTNHDENITQEELDAFISERGMTPEQGEALKDAMGEPGENGWNKESFEKSYDEVAKVLADSRPEGNGEIPGGLLSFFESGDFKAFFEKILGK
mgnify:CR=1 FL=1